jgi:hypothetical protein
LIQTWEISRGNTYLKNLAYKPEGRNMGIKRNVAQLEKNGYIISDYNEVKKQFIEEDAFVSKKDIEYYKYKRWDLVAKKYNGAEFIPYFESYRNKRFWYWTLDVPSGVVWHPNGVKSIDLIAKKINNYWTLTNIGKDLFKNDLKDINHQIVI